MSRRWLQRYIPSQERLQRTRSLRFMHHMLGDPAMWVLSRHSVANACMVGLFAAMLPIPFQMLLAAFGAYCFRGNLPLSVSLVWLTNPLTMPVVFYFNYRVGAWVLDYPARKVPDHITTMWIAEQMAHIVLPLAVGSVLVGLVLALVSNVLVRLIWRFHIYRSWRRRAKRRQRRHQH
ncbi:DUF2062 domain-containing protein [Salinicola salarius]|uniref:DUF2062 domain-containing protein n=1 Tax=Salinicola salarius TaxID=430457 RepID=UPI0023E40123|nr:DUF2062 domain-containing protein [Salinicola salarius]MDF3917677.1 DUF2062 domain-containing protein [Salinicola salarius]